MFNVTKYKGGGFKDQLVMSINTVCKLDTHLSEVSFVEVCIEMIEHALLVLDLPINTGNYIFIFISVNSCRLYNTVHFTCTNIGGRKYLTWKCSNMIFLISSMGFFSL